MKKIIIEEISKKAFKQKGFTSGPFAGCFNCPCGKDKKGGACCRFGCDVDKKSYELMIKYKKKIESAIGKNLEECFLGKWIDSTDYLGGGYRRSKVRKENGFCIFHSVSGKGCELIRLVIETKIPRKMIPTICRLYPLTWENHQMFVYDERYSPIEKGCDCTIKRIKKITDKSIIESQRKEFRDIFEFKGKATKDLKNQKLNSI